MIGKELMLSLSLSSSNTFDFCPSQSLIPLSVTQNLQKLNLQKIYVLGIITLEDWDRGRDTSSVRQGSA